MGVKWKTTMNKLPELAKTMQSIGDKSVKVGALQGDHAWLANIMEYGADIKAKRAKYLTVPIHPDAVGKKARDIPDLFFFKAKSGEKFLAKGDGDDLEFYYWLTPSVKIPERSFLRAGHDKEAERVIEQTERALGQVIDGKMSIDDLYDLCGQQMATAIKDYMRDLQNPPNSPATILAKGSDNPLVGKTGQLIESITWKVE